MLPLPDTVDCTTPFCTVAVLLLCVELWEAWPTVVYAATIAPMHSSPRTTLSHGLSAIQRASSRHTRIA